MKLSTSFHPQINDLTERINQELEQYLQFFIDHRQKDWPEQLVTTEFAINNKIHSTTKVFPFMANYSRELRMEVDIRRKEKVKKAMEFAERMKKMQEETGTVLRKAQEKMK